VVYISDNAEIKLDLITLPIKVPAGVTIASGRGKNGSNGALLFTDTKNLGARAFDVMGSDVRLTGFRLRGPDPYIHAASYSLPNSDGITVESTNLTIDNCELAQWSHAAIYLMPSASGAIIHHNNFHHNRRHGLGYAVDIDSVVAGIYANV